MNKSPQSIWGLRASSRSIWNRARDRSHLTPGQASMIARAITVAVDALADEVYDHTSEEIRDVRNELPDDLSGTVYDLENRLSRMEDELERS